MNNKQFELHMEMLDRIRCGLIDVEDEVAALKAEVASLRSTQQLKREIAALIDKHFCNIDTNQLAYLDLYSFVKQLRQLSRD
jgi:hypothetical protein